jgi:hypothetical protein
VRTKQFLREPLLHFFVLGALLFVLFTWTNDDAMRGPDEIVVDAARVDALTQQFERVWQRAPTPEELSSLVDNWVREEVFYREGLALGLDREDPVLRRRVAQKMEFISEELLSAPATDDELRTWYEDNAEDYRRDPRFSFRQVYFNPSVHGDALEVSVQTALDDMANGVVPDGDATLLPAGLSDASLSEVERTFGQRFAQALTGLAVDDWTGPIVSGYGLHLVRIDDKEESRLPPFDEVRAAVERDFLGERSRELNDTLYETLRQRYTVTFGDGVKLADERGSEGQVQ